VSDPVFGDPAKCGADAQSSILGKHLLKHCTVPDAPGPIASCVVPTVAKAALAPVVVAWSGNTGIPTSTGTFPAIEMTPVRCKLYAIVQHTGTPSTLAYIGDGDVHNIASLDVGANKIIMVAATAWNSYVVIWEMCP
jgi:hypothetical protein